MCHCKVDFFKDQKELISKNEQRQLNIFQISVPLGRVGEADMYCGRQNNAPQPPPRDVLEPVIITLYRNRIFIDVMKLRILKCGDYPGLSE